MNQISTTEDRLPMNSVGMAGGATGAKIAPQNLGEVVKFAEVMCRADIALPKHLRGNAGACMAVALQALEWQLSPFAVASKSYAVNGAIAYEAQLIAAVVNTRSGIKGRLKYRFDGKGNDLTCTVTGVLDGEECEYTSPRIGDITTKNSPLWKSDPQQQLGYFAARSWARRHCPEVILGVYDRDEAEQFRGPDNARDITPARPSLSDRLSIPAQGAPDEREGFNPASLAHEAETPSTDTPEDDDDLFPGDLPTNTNSAAPSTPAEQEGGEVSPPASSPSTDTDAPGMTDHERKRLAAFAKAVLPLAADTDVLATTIEKVEATFAREQEAFGDAAKAARDTIAKSVRAIRNGKTSLESAAAYFGDMLDFDPAELTGERA